jgi:hypothetical protein
MPPRNRKQIPPSPEQGAFIMAEVVHTGSTDPSTPQRIGKIVGVSAEGFFPDEVTPSDGAVTPEVAAEAETAEQTKTANRRRAQVGKHSPLQRDGTYLTLLPGDVLPPNAELGVENPVIVKDSNFERAKLYARRLERLRLQRILQNPTLDTLRVSDVIQVVADGFDMNKALRATQQLKKSQEETPSDELPRFNTLAKRLAVIIDDAEQARFVPGSRTEITVALPLLDQQHSGESPVSDRTHTHLMETYDATKKLVGRKGHSNIVQEWYADRAVASRCYEMVDFYEDAAASLDALADFAALLKPVDGDEAKIEAIASGYHPAMGVIMRHIVAYGLKDNEVAEEDLLFRPMTATQSRTDRVAELSSRATKIGGKKLVPMSLKAPSA